MNKIITSAKILAIAFIATTTNLLANPAAPSKPSTFDASCYITKANKIRVSVEKTDAQPVTISLRQAGQAYTLIDEFVGKKQTKAALQLNVDQLPAGNYELEIKGKDGSRIVKQVQLGTVTPAAAVERSLAIQ